MIFLEIINACKFCKTFDKHLLKCAIGEVEMNVNLIDLANNFCVYVPFPISFEMKMPNVLY